MNSDKGKTQKHLNYSILNAHQHSIIGNLIIKMKRLSHSEA